MYQKKILLVFALLLAVVLVAGFVFWKANAPSSSNVEDTTPAASNKREPSPTTPASTLWRQGLLPEGWDGGFSGAIASMGNQKMTIAEPGGESVSLTLDSDTQYFLARGVTTESVSSSKVLVSGQWATVYAKVKGGELHARSITYPQPE